MQGSARNPGYDHALALSLCCGDADLLAALQTRTQAFLTDDERGARLAAGNWQAGDPKVLAGIAHQGVGLCRQCGLMDLAVLFEQIEHALKARQLEGASALLEPLREEMRNAQHDMAAWRDGQGPREGA